MFRRLREKLRRMREETGKGLLQLAMEDYEKWKQEKILQLLEWKEKKLAERERRRKDE